MKKKSLSAEVDFNKTYVNPDINIKDVKSDDLASTANQIVGSWIKGILTRTIRTIETNSGKELEIMDAGSPIVNGVYLEGPGKADEAKR